MTRATAHDLGTALALCLCLGLFSGCVALTNPVANGIPVRLLPEELKAKSEKDKVMIPLNVLRQQRPESRRLVGGDVLGVYVEGVLGSRDQLPPVNFPVSGNLPPSLGFPVPVREDGTVAMPLIAPVHVEGMTIPEAETAVKQAFITPQIIQPTKSVIVTLMRPRRVRVLVMRQDEPGRGGTAEADLGLRLRQSDLTGANFGGGTGHIVELPVGENDVLSALAETGGLPGANGVNEIVILRGKYNPDRDQLLPSPQPALPPVSGQPVGEANQVVRIPLRQRKGERLPFKPEDVVLQDGDIVFINQRTAGVFYTGGLLRNGEHKLPRDSDLTVTEAIMQTGGPILGGTIIGNNFNGNLVEPGLGHASPSLLTVLRQAPKGGQVTIRVDLNQALRDPRQNLLVQAGDVLLLQQTPEEAILRYVSEIFRFTVISEIIQSSTTSGSAGATYVP